MGACGSKEADNEFHDASANAPQQQQQQQQRPVKSSRKEGEERIMGNVGSLGPLEGKQSQNQQPPQQKQPEAANPQPASPHPTPTPTAAQPQNPKGLHITVKEEPSVSMAPSAMSPAPFNALSPSAVAFHDQTPKPQPSVRSSDNGKSNASSVDLEGVKIAMTPDAASASASPTPLASPLAGVKLPGEDKSERMFDVPSLDTNTLMSFACERLQVCFSTASQLNTPALQARRQEPETVALESLRKLRFRSDGLQEVARKDLVPAMTEVLRALTMENTKVHLLEICGIPADQTIMRALSVVIRANKALGVLHLHLSREGHTTLKGQAKVSQELCQSLQFNKRLNTLDLSGTYLGAAEGAILADLINYNTSLLHLNLSKTGLGAAGGHMAAMIQVNTSLINIDLSNNDFGDGGGRGIAHALAANANVTKLDLGENNLTVSTVTDIAKFLTANRTLRDLSLRDNDLGVPGGNALSALLKSNRTIVALNINGCNLGIIGAKWLAKGLESNSHLTSLGLAYNDIQFDGCKAICTAIRGNTTLAHLDLTGNSIGAKGSKEIKHLLQVNKCLQTLQLAHNNFKPKHEERIDDMLDQSCAIRNHIKFSPRTILFPVDFGRTVDLKTHLVLTNTGSPNSKMKNTTAYPLTFQIASNVPAHHIIYPSMGFIQPGASVAIRIRLRGRFAKEYCRHQLTLRTMPVEPEATKSSAAGLWNERTGIAAKEASTYILRCDWSLSGNEGGMEWTAQNQETIDAHVSQGDQRARAFGSTSGPSLLLQVPSASSVAAEELKAGREKLLNDIHALRALLQEKSAKESQIEIELAEAQKRETKLQAELARARLKASAKKSKGNGAFDVSDLFFDDLEDDDDLLMLGLGRGGSHRSHRRRQRRRDEDLLDLLGESSGSGSGDDLFDDDDRGGRRGGRGGKGSGTGGGGGGGDGDGDGGDGDGGDGTGTGDGSGKSGKDKPAKPPSFAPTRKPLDVKKKPNHFGGDGGDTESSSSSEDEKEEEKKEFKPDENVVTGGAAPMAPPMAPPILGGGDVPFAPPMDGSIPMAPGMGPPPLPTKKAIKPAVEMRKLHWQVVGAGDVSGTLWKDLDDGDVLGDADLREFESVFGAAAPTASSGSAGGSGKAGSGKPGAKKKNPEDEDKIIFVDPKRSFNLDITLSRFRITSEQIRDCILACDDSVLTEEKLDALLKFAPLPDETKMLKKFTGDPAKLGKSEQYLRIVSAIPRLNERLELLLFKMQYPDLVTSIETALNYVEQARSQIKDSQNLKEVLKIVLAFGNYMNGGTRNGQAFGFQLDTLTKLRSAKSTDNSSNLLNFLVQHIQKKNPSISAFVTDLNAVKTACRVESSHVSKQVQRVNKHLTQLKKELRKAEELSQAGTAPAGDRFLSAFQEFYAGAHEKAKGLEKRQIQIEKECNELAAFFGAKHITKWEDLFVIFDDFLADYQSSERFLEAVRIREEAKLRREQATAAMSKGRSQSTSAASGMSLQEQMERRRSAMGGSVGSSAAATSGTPATVQEDHGIDLGDDSDWESD